LEVGKFGDLVVLAENPFEVDQRTIKDIKVERTVIGEDIVYQSKYILDDRTNSPHLSISKFMEA
jgi:hypothetical protein